MITFMTYEKLNSDALVDNIYNSVCITTVGLDNTIIDNLRCFTGQSIVADAVYIFSKIAGDGTIVEEVDFAGLLQNKYSYSALLVPAGAFKMVGGLNDRLEEGQFRELLLRLAKAYKVFRVSGNQVSSEQISPFDKSSFETEAYIFGRYVRDIQDIGCFNQMLTELIQKYQVEALAGRMEYLEDMISHGIKYLHIERGTEPILMYRGVTYCYNVLNNILEGMGHALESLGERVEYYDEQVEDVAGLAKYIGRNFKAIIGIQSYLFSVYIRQENCYLHDMINGPKFNMILDHPVWLNEQLKNVSAEQYVLTHDDNYRKFILKHYSKVQGAYVLPPAVNILDIGEGRTDSGEKIYDLVFIGTYGDYRKRLQEIRTSQKEVRIIASHYLKQLRKNSELTAEAAFRGALDELGITLADEEQFLELMYSMRGVQQCIMYYYREKIVEQIIEAGIRLDVWGDSWKNAPYSDNRLLCIHDEIPAADMEKVLEKARLSLNIMAWHKAGFTERIASSMLSRALVLTDRTDTSQMGFRDGTECIMYSLSEIHALPNIIRDILADSERLNNIVDNAYDSAIKYHTWNNRMRQLISILNDL